MLGLPVIPTDVNVDALVADLADSTVAIDDAYLKQFGGNPKQLRSDLQHTIDPSANANVEQALGDTRVVVVGSRNLTVENARDVAQAIKDRVHADTIIVQSPNKAGVVSDVASRYTIENYQGAMAGSASPGQTHLFINNVAHDSQHLELFNIFLLCALALAIGGSTFTARLLTKG